MNTPENIQQPVSARRRLFQVMAAGGVAAVVLPEKWVKPVVDAVIVPAHAAGSVTRVHGIFGNSGPLFASSNRLNPLERFAEMFVGSAHAEISDCTIPAENVACISFDISLPPSSDVGVRVVRGNVAYTVVQISSNNAIQDVTLDGYSFSNVIATSTAVSGMFGYANCVSAAFTLPRRSTNACANPI